MAIRRSACIFGMLMSLWVAPAYAEERLRTFEEILASAQEESPIFKRVRARTGGALAESIEKGALQNPELFAEMRPLTDGGGESETGYEVGFQQPLSPSAFGARQRLARQIRELATQDEKLELLKLEQELLLQYVHVWSLQEHLKFQRNNLTRTEKILSQLSAAARGAITSSSHWQVKAHQARLSADLEGLEGDLARAQASLEESSGTKVRGETLRELPSWQPPITGSAEDLPAASLIKLRDEIARAQQNVAQLDTFPKFVPRIAFEHDIDGTDTVNVGISIDLPIFNRNQAEVLRAQSERAVSSSALQVVKDGRFAHQISLLTDAARHTTVQLDAYREQVLPAAERAMQAALKELHAGQTSPVYLLQVLSELETIQSRYLELEVKLCAERVALAVLRGRSF